MATGQVKVTTEALAHMASKLRQSAEDIMALKSQMDQALNGFLWEDPVGIRFKTVQYPEGFKPLQEILIPDIQELVNRINMIGQETDLWAESNDYPSGAGGGNAAGAGGDFGGHAGAGGGGTGNAAGAGGGDHLPGGKGYKPYDSSNDTNPFSGKGFKPYDSSNDTNPFSGKGFKPYDSSNDTNPFKDL